MADPIRVLGLFAGIGGLELAVRAGLSRVGRGVRHVALVEREGFAVAVLAAAMERGDLAPAPVWLGDVREFPAAAFRGSVDLVCGGFPCQDISAAGKQAGLDGERSALFFDLERIARVVGARYLFMENVAAINVRGLDTVLGTLADGGWDAEWLHLRASDVGAPHRRERWFCLAYRRGERPQGDGATGPGARATGRVRGAELAHARRAGSGWPEDAHDERGQRAPGLPRGAGAELPAWPPRPDDAEGWRRVLEQRPDLAPALAHAEGRATGRVSEPGRDGGALRAPDGRRDGDAALADGKRAGLRGQSERDEQATRRQPAQLGHDADGRGSPGRRDRREGRDEQEAEPALRRVADGLPDGLDRALLYRTDRLRALGNAVCWRQGAAAFVELWQRIHGEA